MPNFGEIELGQPLPCIEVAAPTAGTSPGSLVEHFVRTWAGVEAVLEKVQITRHLPTQPGETIWLDGKVYGRHMDGSRCIEVKVTGRDAGGDRLGGMVRVKLA
jgi:hypothetical protein